MYKNKEIINKKFNRLTVLKLASSKEISRRKVRRCLCLCDCGKKKIVYLSFLTSGHTKSCGCLSMDVTVKRNYKHGMVSRKNPSKFYFVWNSMVQRCINKKSSGYYKYGAKGIKIAKRWLLFKNFMDDMHQGYLDHVNRFGEKNTQIDRINPFGNYKKSNCRWVTILEQAHNKKKNYVIPRKRLPVPAHKMVKAKR